MVPAYSKPDVFLPKVEVAGSNPVSRSNPFSIPQVLLERMVQKHFLLPSKGRLIPSA